MKTKFMLICLGFLFSVFLSSCAKQISISPMDMDISKNKNYNLKVGYIISAEELAQEVITPAGGGDSVKYKPYEALMRGLNLSLEQVFLDAIHIQSFAELKDYPDIQLVFDPSLVKTDSSSSSIIFWPPENFTVKIDCYIYDRKKNKIQKVNGHGYGTATSADWLGHFDKFGIAGQRAMQKAIQDLFVKLDYNKIANLNESPKSPSKLSTSEKNIVGLGTGFIITHNGHVLTCHHVIKGSKEIKIVHNGNTYSAELIRDDPYNDLALLKIDGKFNGIAFSERRSAKMGQSVFTIGYPNPGLQGVNAKYTEGTVNCLTGIQDDLRVYQMSVPVQPGNSGGALLDENGNVVGIIMAMLDAQTTFNISGSLPQNVNYAIKSSYAQAMLDTIPEVSKQLLVPSNNASDAVERVQKSTVMILSYK